MDGVTRWPIETGKAGHATNILQPLYGQELEAASFHPNSFHKLTLTSISGSSIMGLRKAISGLGVPLSVFSVQF